MAGQGRNADGLTGSQPRDAPNVVRFPGDWFGPLGDLVPIGTDTDREQDGQDLYVDQLGGVGADSFWGEDAEDVHRVGTPAPVSQPGGRSLRSRLVLPIGGVAVTAAAVAVMVAVNPGSGTQVGKPGRVASDSQARSAVAHLALASQERAAGRAAGLARPVDNAREHAHRLATPRHTTAKHGLPASIGARPNVYVTVTQGNTAAAANAAAGDVSTGDVVTGDVATPTGLVSPPPNATQLNP
jgi:hypothetical protein